MHRCSKKKNSRVSCTCCTILRHTKTPQISACTFSASLSRPHYPPTILNPPKKSSTYGSSFSTPKHMEHLLLFFFTYLEIAPNLDRLGKKKTKTPKKIFLHSRIFLVTVLLKKQTNKTQENLKMKKKNAFSLPC